MTVEEAKTILKKAGLQGEFLGGVKSINRFEAALMHQVYLKKYSKIRMKE